MDQKLALRLRFTGGLIDSQGLDLYDGSASFHGFAKAIQLITHAYMNDESVMRATALKGAEIYFSAPRRGSIIWDIATIFKRKPKTAPLTADTYYDFLKTTFERATGNLEIVPSTAFVEQRISDDEPFFDQLSEKLEGSLQMAHRSIDNEDAIVTLERPRSTLVEFNTDTSAWVNTRDEDPHSREFRGNMTRFNTKTGNGRAYIQQIGKIVPVRKSDHFVARSKPWLTWSLHGDNTAGDKDLVFVGRRIESASGETKRIVLDDCRKA